MRRRYTARRLVRLHAGPQGIHPQTHLVHLKGVLQADAYSGFNALFDGRDIQEAACWAHARRKFYCLNKASPSALTTEALRRIAELYAIEAQVRGKRVRFFLLSRFFHGHCVGHGTAISASFYDPLVHKKSDRLKAIGHTPDRRTLKPPPNARASLTLSK